MILDHKGTPIFYTDKGKGQAIVLLHGFLENSKMWDAFLPELIKKTGLSASICWATGKRVVWVTCILWNLWLKLLKPF